VQRVVLVGHSFGGAVVITAGAVHDRVAGVVALASQTYGARLAGQLAPRPLLVVHGKADTRLPYTCGVQIYAWAPGAQTARPVRGGRTPFGRMRRRVGPAVNAVASRDPPRRSLSIVSVTCSRVQTRLSCFEVFSGESGRRPRRDCYVYTLSTAECQPLKTSKFLMEKYHMPTLAFPHHHTHAEVRSCTDLAHVARWRRVARS
jgi:pimeloyl-ACP methyl ester carboxylesterase